LWLLGYPDQAQARSTAAVALARHVRHPFCRAIAPAFAFFVSYCRSDGTAAQAWADEMLMLTTEQGFAHWQAQGMILRGWAVAPRDTFRRGQHSCARASPLGRP
jgi:hypothetical protein